MDEQFVTVQDVGKKLGFSHSHSHRNIKKRFSDIIIRKRGPSGHSVYQIPVNKEQEVLDYFNGINTIPAPGRQEGNSAARRVKTTFESQGWVAHILTPDPPGTPDLIMHKDGVTRYREVKARGDGLRKEQWAEILRLRVLGFDAWVCDDEGIDWPTM